MKKLVAGAVLGCLLLFAGSAWAQAAKSASSVTQHVQEYRIGVEDQLLISVWGEPDLSMSVTVRPDGRITLPLINDVKVAGMTTDEFRVELSTQLSRFVTEPSVTVIVEQINSFKVYFLGDGINIQGIQSFQKPTRLLQALAAAGGFAEFAKKDIKIFREQGGGEIHILVDFKQILNGATGTNLFLKPGDTLVVD
jgi:polysaccharide export outer membrane protein